MPRRKEPCIPNAVLDQLLAGADPKTAFDPNGLIDDLKKALAERVLNAEMDHHLAGEEPGNRRNGYGKKTVITDSGHIELEVPRDRQARFDPQLIAKYQRCFPGFDDKIISMYARGMSSIDDQAQHHQGVAESPAGLGRGGRECAIAGAGLGRAPVPHRQEPVPAQAAALSRPGQEHRATARLIRAGQPGDRQENAARKGLKLIRRLSRYRKQHP
jgi:hypothetical protein